MQVDDHPAVRRVLRSLLEEVGGWQVAGEADSGEPRHGPDPGRAAPGRPQPARPPAGAAGPLADPGQGE